MSGFMEGYGVKEARRGRIILRTAIAVVTVAILATGGYFYFRTYNEERVFARFKDTLAKQDYASAYRMWCTAEHPCPYYPMEKFTADWGPSSPYAKINEASVEHVDYCDSGVVFDLSLAGADPVAVWVERSTGILSFYPYQRCRGIKHLEFGPLLRRLFGGSEKG
jgi:hypothetical protein